MADSEQEIVTEWIEQIPDHDRLFLRVHITWVPDRKIVPGIFREHGGAMSVDWEKYSTAEETRLRGRDPEKNGVVSLVAGAVRAIEQMTVEHEPIRSNRAHSGIHGLNSRGQLSAQVMKTMRRAKLFHLVKDWEIQPSEEA